MAGFLPGRRRPRFFHYDTRYQRILCLPGLRQVSHRRAGRRYVLYRCAAHLGMLAMRRKTPEPEQGRGPRCGRTPADHGTGLRARFIRIGLWQFFDTMRHPGGDCFSVDDRVFDSRLHNGMVRRRRECKGCGRRFTTFEITEAEFRRLQEAAAFTGRMAEIEGNIDEFLAGTAPANTNAAGA